MKETMRPGTPACGPGPHRVSPRHPPWAIAHFLDADDEAGVTPPLIDPLDDRDGRG
jgi:hypothetical protein